MAGDKQYFYYAQQVQKRTGVSFQIWGNNRLERSDFKTGFCGFDRGGYKDNNKKPMAPITVLLKDTEVTVYDRRAGGVIERRRFAPKDECPMFIMRRAGENSMDSYTPRDAISAWLRDYVAGGARPETVELK